MSVIILGGNECMERQYKELCKSYNCKAKIFIKPSGSLKNKLGNPDLMICFTGALSHKVLKNAQNWCQEACACEWMRLWEDEARDAGADLVVESVMANNEPDDDAFEACKALGAALA